MEIGDVVTSKTTNHTGIVISLKPPVMKETNGFYVIIRGDIEIICKTESIPTQKSNVLQRIEKYISDHNIDSSYRISNSFVE